jgi:saccharopine dehydrogenase (NAD+, L-lysine-forming)
MQDIYIRTEDIPNEFRTPLVPSDVRKLIKKGFQVYVQTSKNRIYKDSEYSRAGAVLTTQKWYNKKYKNALIVGLKELYTISYLDNHTHIYFSHSFKNQTNSQEILTEFKKSKSTLHDFEYFLDDKNKRLIAFGSYAGQAGATLGLLQYYNNIYNKKMTKLKPWSSCIEMYENVGKHSIENLKIAIIGPNGRCGKGVQKVLKDLSKPFDKYDKTSDFSTLQEYDIIYNCILLDETYNKVWLSSATQFTKPLVIVDISCDYSKSNNPIQLYKEATTWDEPVFQYNNYVDIIAIDNLPSLLPKESSDEFSNIFKNLLLMKQQDEQNPIWQKNLQIYREKSEKVEKIEDI